MTQFRFDDPDENGIVVIWIDQPYSKVNVLNQSLIPEFEKLLKQFNERSDIEGLIIASGKENSFVAGADITMLNSVKTQEGGVDISSMGQKAMNDLASLGVPTVAAIHGDCLGGGLELALACRGRVASNSPKTKLALPEVMLGLLPGAGGTRRLPRLIGLTAALDMLLTGRNIRAEKAYKMGLVDDLVPVSQLISSAKKLVLALKKGKKAKGKAKPFSQKLQSFVLEQTPFGRKIVFSKAQKMIMSKTHGMYPAPLKIIDVLKADSDEAESRGFGALLVTSESIGLRHLFHCITTLKKEDGPGTADLESTSVQHVGMLGAGLMGGGIATVLADKGITVRLKDVTQDGLEHALDYAHRYFDKARRRKRYTRSGYEERMNRLSGGLEYDGLAHADVVIEAVPENIELKKKVLKDVEARSNCIFASNTSSLPISEIAEGAAHPEKVIGMHFFSPVEKMPLVEVIVTPQTSPIVTKTVVQLSRKMGKHVIVVNDCAGFYTTRILAPYMVEALFMLIEGHSILDIDLAAQRLGFAVGPITLMDEVGIDIGAKVTSVMKKYYSEHMEFPDSSATDAFIKEGRLGKKVSKGFYLYEKGKSVYANGSKVIDPTVLKHMPEGTVPQKANLEHMGQRLLLALINEASRCMEEGVLMSPESGDLGAVFGIGFPPMKGGPFKALDEMTTAKAVEELQSLAVKYGKRFKPADILVKMSEKEERFYPLK
jgi:3-hydroxyacyl-CoA dehydrogenase / enoyl-CoA hydratase / 3-hydroxybutyryl-CoA epimerase